MTLRIGTLRRMYEYGEGRETHAVDKYLINFNASVSDAKELGKWIASILPMAEYHTYNMAGQTDIVLGWIMMNQEDAALFRMHYDVDLMS